LVEESSVVVVLRKVGQQALELGTLDLRVALSFEEEAFM
jgi:hypothetical protein